MLYIAIEPQHFSKKILRVCNVTLDDAFLKYTLLQTIAFICLVAGILIADRAKKTEIPKLNLFNYRSVRILGLSFFAIGVLCYCIFLHNIGGLSYLLLNLDKRYEVQTGQYILKLLPVIGFGPVLMLLCVKLKNRFSDKAMVVVFTLATVMIFSSFGARKSAVVFLIGLLIVFNYLIYRFRINKVTVGAFFVIALIVSFYILIIPQIRKEGVAANLGGNKERIFKTFDIRHLVYNISYTYIDVFAANFYNKDNAWYFKGILDPFTYYLNRSTNKELLPPVDQGLYFNSTVIYGKNCAPPMMRKDLTKTSWPIENFGFGYANFLIPGLVIAFLLQGMVFSYCYNFLKKNLYNPIAVVLYVFMLFNFNFSNIRLMQFMLTVPLFLTAFFIVNKFGRQPVTATD